MKTFLRLLPPALALIFAASVSAQTVTVTASNIGGTVKLASGQFCITPVDASNHPLQASALGGSSGGAITYAPQCWPVTAGALPSGVTAPDSALATPTNMCQRWSVTDSTGRQIYMYPCVQPSSNSTLSPWCSTSGGVTTCPFDQLKPSLGSVTPVVSPTLAIGTVSTGTPGSSAAASVAGASPNYSLNLTIPAGVAGPNCETGQPAGTCNMQGANLTNVGSVAVGATPPASWTTATAWGDSLTYGDQDGSSTPSCGTNNVGGYPCFLQQLFSGKTVNNEGIPGQSSSQIAVRMNAYVGTSKQQATISGGAIPTSGSVGITFTSGYEPSYNANTTTANCVLIVISGVQGCASAITSTTYQFTRSASGSAVSSPANSQWTAVTTNLLTGPQIVLAGYNNLSSPSTVEADIAAMVAVFNSNSLPYLILSLPVGEGNGIGSTTYNTIEGLNASLAASYGANFIRLDQALLNGYNPAVEADVIDYNAKVSPVFSQRAVDANGTLTSAINSTTCTIPLTFVNGGPAGGLEGGNILTVGTELIYVSTFTGTTVNTCTRGYAGTTAASYSAGQTFTATDWVHMSTAAGLGLYGISGYSRTAQTLQPLVGATFTQQLTLPSGNTLALGGSQANGPQAGFDSTGALIASGEFATDTGASLGDSFRPWRSAWSNYIVATGNIATSTGANTTSLDNGGPTIGARLYGWGPDPSTNGGVAILGANSNNTSTTPYAVFQTGSITMSANPGTQFMSYNGSTVQWNATPQWTPSGASPTYASGSIALENLGGASYVDFMGTLGAYGPVTMRLVPGGGGTAINFLDSDSAGNLTAPQGMTGGYFASKGYISSSPGANYASYDTDTTGNARIVGWGANSTTKGGAVLEGYSSDGSQSETFAQFADAGTTLRDNGTAWLTTTSSAVSITRPLAASAISVASARKGTFVCTAGGTITVANANELVTSDVVISLNIAGGTISTPPAMKTVTAGTGFTVLCGASDTSTYNYDILN